jgi:aspartyl-tRNA(Asn)/glutamyl-tRNA(Gln) amidotransferase subunit B
VDANVSIEIEGVTGTRTETKNIHSFREIEKCLDFEISRQKELIDQGKVVQPETRAAVNG